MQVALKKSGPGVAGVLAGLHRLKKAQALVGIPQANATREDNSSGINNAEALFLFTNGSQVNNIPPRPVIEPAITATPTRTIITKNLAAASSAALHGDLTGMLEALDRAGQVGESASKAWFTDPRNGWPQNTRKTIRRKIRRLKGKQFKAAIAALANGSGAALDSINTPGIDTGQMRRAITHIVDPGDGSIEDSAGAEWKKPSGSESGEDIGDAIAEAGD